MQLLGEPRKMLREALKSGFQDFDELNRFSKEVLAFDLNDRTDRQGGKDNAVDTLMTVMDERGKVQRLVSSARAERPNNPLLRQVEQHLALTFNPFSDVQPPPELEQKLRDIGPERVIVESAGFPSSANFLSVLGAAEFRVCYISYSLPGGTPVYGTGFLIADDLVMTNEHVIRGAREPELPFTLSGNTIKASFGFRTAGAKKTDFSLAERDWLVAVNPEALPDGTKGLDYAVLRLAAAAGAEAIGGSSDASRRGFLAPIAYTPSEGEPLLILQHPYDKVDAMPSSMRLTIGFVTKVDSNEIRHTANTSQGSSGSPVFNSRMELIALHHWGDVGFNVAKRFGSIKDDLAAKGFGAIIT
jgi:hypothetical protein